MLCFCCCCCFQEGGDFIPRDENGKVLFSDVDYLDTWRVSLSVWPAWLGGGVQTLFRLEIWCIKFTSSNTLQSLQTLHCMFLCQERRESTCESLIVLKLFCSIIIWFFFQCICFPVLGTLTFHWIWSILLEKSHIKSELVLELALAGTSNWTSMSERTVAGHHPSQWPPSYHYGPWCV